LATKICQRSVERVRIVFSVPWLSSDDDVARDERRDQREEPDRAEQQPDERDSEAGSLDIAPNGTSSGPPLLDSRAMMKISGTSAAAPRPRYVRFWERSLRSSQR
jgi:hypothetical protein